MNRKITREDALRSALASAKMEGFQITPKIESDCRRIISGEISIADYVQQTKDAHAFNEQAN